MFPEKQIMILHLDDYSANRAKTILKVYDFLTLGMYRITTGVICEGS